MLQIFEALLLQIFEAFQTRRCVSGLLLHQFAPYQMHSGEANQIIALVVAHCGD